MRWISASEKLYRLACAMNSRVRDFNASRLDLTSSRAFRGTALAAAFPITYVPRPRWVLTTPAAFEHAIRTRHGVEVDAQLSRQRPHCWQLVPRLQPPRLGAHGLPLDLLHNLQVDGQPGPEVELQGECAFAIHHGIVLIVSQAGFLSMVRHWFGRLAAYKPG